MTWEQLRELMLERLADWVRTTQRLQPGQAVDVFRDPVWAVYACSRCGQKRPGFANVQRSFHKGCGQVVQLKGGLTWAQARAAAPVARPLGISIPEGVALTKQQQTYCVDRLVAELDAGVGRPTPVEGMS